MRTYHCFWLLFWFGPLHQSYSTPLSKKATGFPENLKVLDLSRNSRKELSRSKRSWMWNQFFLLEEYTGSDYQYVGKVGYFNSFQKLKENSMGYYSTTQAVFNPCVLVVTSDKSTLGNIQ